MKRRGLIGGSYGVRVMDQEPTAGHTLRAALKQKSSTTRSVVELSVAPPGSNQDSPDPKGRYNQPNSATCYADVPLRSTSYYRQGTYIAE